MQIIKSSFSIDKLIDGEMILKSIERIGRTCYKSEEGIKNDSAAGFVSRLLARGHEAMIEHESISIRVICDRGVTHEIVRHRVASYAQESTRYCNYSKEKFGQEITVIDPRDAFGWDMTKEADREKFRHWRIAMHHCEQSYFAMLKAGATAQEARNVLPNSLKTEIVITMNLREWRHFFKLRCDKAAHPQMREIAISILKEFKKLVPVIFDDIYPEYIRSA